jgi:hypothetical protein
MAKQPVNKKPTFRISDSMKGLPQTATGSELWFGFAGLIIGVSIGCDVGRLLSWVLLWGLK